MPNYDKEIELLAMNPHEFSPVLVSGNSGNGKSMFLDNFCKRRRKLYKPAFSERNNSEYLKIFSARELFESIIESISMAYPKAWREQFADHDIIIIDDFDTVAGRPTMQEELFSYFLTCNKAIIVATKSEITEPDFSPELVSFFSSGAHVRIEAPDEESMLDFLINQLAIDKITTTEEALLWLTQQNFTSFAAIKGFIKTLRLFKTDSAYTLEDCKRLAKSYIR